MLLAAGAVLFGVAGLPDRTVNVSDPVSAVSLAAGSGNEYDSAVFAYSQDPTNLFAPVYAIAPTGAEDVTVTSADGDVHGTQDFEVSSLGFPVDTFTGNVEYAPVSSPLDPFGSPYEEVVTATGTPGTVLPENTAFLITEFGAGYGNVLEESMNSAGTSATVGDFLLTPFGDENITPIVDLFLPAGVTSATDVDPGSAPDPSMLTDLFSSMGL